MNIIYLFGYFMIFIYQLINTKLLSYANAPLHHIITLSKYHFITKDL